jgi:hypothetical protein
MRSRAARFSSSALACLVLVAAALFIARTERSITTHQTAVNAFDLHAREAAARLGDVRFAQQAYVAAGQNAAFWMSKVATLVPETTTALDALRPLATGESARQSLLDASSAMTEFASIDKRARDYVAADQSLMASDVVFTEGGDTTAAAARHIESARLAEHQSFDAFEAGQRRLQAYAIGGASGLTLVLLLLFAAVRPREAATTAPATTGRTMPATSLVDTPTRDAVLPAPVPAPALAVPADDVLDRTAIALSAAADVCTEFGRLQDMADLKRLLAKAATTMEARGLIVWLGSAAGADLRPVVAHGYSDQVLALMRAVPRHADNAAAAAYRTGTLQIVPAKPGTSLGAVVAPMLSAEGCVGALTAEVENDGEVSDTIHALATIIASQVTSVVASAQPSTATTRIATA